MAHTEAQRDQNTARCYAGTSSRNGSRGQGIKNGALLEKKDLSQPWSKLRMAL